MITIQYKGRLGNRLLIYAAAYIFAKKFNFTICSDIVQNIFGLPAYKGVEYDRSALEVITVDDKNFMHLLQSDWLPPNHYHFNGYFQHRDFILNYHHEIKNLFNPQYTAMPDNSVFVAYRIGDIMNQRQMLPIDYYREALQHISAEAGFITSDTPSHPNVLQLAQEFNLQLYGNGPNRTINFGKNFNNIVLSEGTFSWWIGFLSKAKNIYYNERDRFWHGDIFVFPDWKQLKYDNI
jgi:hypothetical protein